MTDSRVAHTATLLPNGKLLLAGGFKLLAENSSAELYDPASGINGSWTATGSLQFARESHTATLLSSGKVLVTGGYGGSGNLQIAELFDPSIGNNGMWSRTDDMSAARYGHTATLLDAGKVLIVAGEISSGAELYDPFRF